MNKVLKYISEEGPVSPEELALQIMGFMDDGYPEAAYEIEDLIKRKIIAQDPDLGIVFRACEMQLVVWEGKLWSRRLVYAPNALYRGYQQSYTSKPQDRTYIHPAQWFIAKHEGELYRVRQNGVELKSSYDHVFLVKDIDEVIQYDKVPQDLSPQKGLKGAQLSFAFKP